MGNFIDISGLEDLEEQFRALGKYAFADALQEAVNDLADIAVGDLAGRFDKNIEGGPASFTKIRPGRGNSSVVAKKRVGATKGVAEASMLVRPKQSAYLKYMLGEEDVREAGDTGVADSFNFIPFFEHLAHKRVRIKPTKSGNLPRNALKRLVAMTQTEKLGPVDRDREERGRFKRSETGDRTLGGVFFGRARRQDGSPGSLGFWLRRSERGAKILPLALAFPKSDYVDKDYLVDDWNRAVEVAQQTIQDRIRKHLNETLSDMEAGRETRTRRKNRLAREERTRLRAIRHAEYAAGIRVRKRKGRPPKNPDAVPRSKPKKRYGIAFLDR